MQNSAPDPIDPPLQSVAVTVTRTGGIAGLRRTWTAEAGEDATPWIALIERCPWNAADHSDRRAPSGADRFVWRVTAQCGDSAREAELVDSDVLGPWRELIDAVRAAPGPTR